MNLKDYKVGLFVPCDIDQFSPQTAWNALHLLEGMGLKVHYPTDLTGSGMELYNMGDKQMAKQLGEKMIESFCDCTHVVSLSSATVAYVQKRFTPLFRNTTLLGEYRNFIAHFIDFSDFLVNDVGFTPSKAFPHRVAFMDNCQTLCDYHSPSHGKRGLREEPRQLLRSVPELHLVEMKQNNTCCGYGGLFVNHYTIISDKMAQMKIDNALSVNAEYIAATEMSCLLHLRSYAEKKKIDIRFIHLADIM